MLVSFVLIGVGVLAIHPRWASSVGADVWSASAYQERIRTSDELHGRLERENQETLRRMAVKESIVEELLAGRVTLAEATDQFAEINESLPHSMDRIRATCPGQSDREKLARNVIAFARARAPGHEWDAVERRLEAELQQMLNHSAGE
jgi:hypothetical protein